MPSFSSTTRIDSPSLQLTPTRGSVSAALLIKSNAFSRYLFPMSADGGVGSKRRADFSLIKRDIKAGLADLAALTTPANSSGMPVRFLSEALT